MPNLLPGQSTLAVIRNLTAEKCDQPTPSDQTNVTIATYDRMINRSGRELIRLLNNSYQDYFVNPDTGNPFRFETDGINWSFPLPDDFQHLRGVDIFQQPWNQQTAMTAQRFMNQERNRYNYFLGTGIICPLYSLVGNEITFIPRPPQAGLGVQLNYVPVLPDMTDRGTITLTQNFAVGASVFIAALSSIPQGPPDADGEFPALIGVEYVAIDNDDFPTNTAERREFKCGTSAATAAANLAASINLAGDYGLPWGLNGIEPAIVPQDNTQALATVLGTVITLNLYSALSIVWYSRENTVDAEIPDLPSFAVTLDPLPVASQYNPYGAWSNFCAVYNGWDELIALDAGIQIMSKQEKFGMVEVLKSQKREKWDEIRAESNNRNAAQAARTTNTWRMQGRGNLWLRGGGTGGL